MFATPTTGDSREIKPLPRAKTCPPFCLDGTWIVHTHSDRFTTVAPVAKHLDECAADTGPLFTMSIQLPWERMRDGHETAQTATHAKCLARALDLVRYKLNGHVCRTGISQHTHTHSQLVACTAF